MAAREGENRRPWLTMPLGSGKGENEAGWFIAAECSRIPCLWQFKDQANEWKTATRLKSKDNTNIKRWTDTIFSFPIPIPISKLADQQQRNKQEHNGRSNVSQS